MIRCRSLAVSALALLSLSSAGCGGSSPAQPGATPTVAPTATPAPTPTPMALSVIPPCALPAAGAGSVCDDAPSPTQLKSDVDAAIDRVISVRPDLFNFNDIDGGPRILDYDKYMTAVVAALGQAGLCGRIDPEGEIAVKLTNKASEQWIIASKAGYNPPVGNWVKRKYVGSCRPAIF